MARHPWWILPPAVALLGFVASAWAETEIDPAAVSEGLKAIFKYGSGTKGTADRLNANTLTIMTGTIAGTYVQFGADLASALDDGDNLRVLAIIGRGSVQGVADILFLKGVDLGIVRSDTLDYLEKKGYANNIKKQFTFITKLYNEEMHVLAPKSVNSMAELEGKTVAVDLPNGGTFVTSAIVFERLGIHANFAYIEQRLAFERLKKGEIDAMIWVQGKPSKFSTTIKDDNFHLIPVDYAKSLQPDYLPAQLTSDDYPNLIPKGERIDTIAVPGGAGRLQFGAEYRALSPACKVRRHFNKIAVLQQPPFHPKWKEVALSAPLPGWSRFRPAQEWLDRSSSAMASADVRRRFDRFLNENQMRQSPGDREALFRQFLEWQRQQAPTR